MNFTVTYRTTSGARTVETVEATSRAEVFAKMKARGITPLSVAEGGKLPRPKKPAAGGNRTVLRGAIAGILVVLVALAAWYFLAPSEKPAPKPAPKAVKPKPKPAPKVEKPSPPPKPKLVETNVIAKAPVPVKPDQPRPIPPGGYLYTNEEGVVKRHLVDIDKSRLKTVTNRLFKTGTEQVISWVFTTRLGDNPMPLPPLSKKEKENIWSILQQECEVNETDTKREAEAKAIVNEIKKEMRQYLQDGGTPEEFLEYYHSQLRTAAMRRQESIRAAMKVRRESPEMFEDYVNTLNERLRAEGIREMKLPPVGPPPAKNDK